MYSEECGKVHFQYYTLKNEKRFVTGEMNYLLSVVNRCNGEYVSISIGLLSYCFLPELIDIVLPVQIIMDSYKDWLSKKSMSFLCELSEAGEKLVEQKVVVSTGSLTVWGCSWLKFSLFSYLQLFLSFPEHSAIEIKVQLKLKSGWF